MTGIRMHNRGSIDGEMDEEQDRRSCEVKGVSNERGTLPTLSQSLFGGGQCENLILYLFSRGFINSAVGSTVDSMQLEH